MRSQYERIALLRTGRLVDPVDRDAAGRRSYGDNAIAQVVFVTRMRATGMTIRALREYLDLARAGDHTADRRRELLHQHRVRLRGQRAAIDACLEVIDRKLSSYPLAEARTPKRVSR